MNTIAQNTDMQRSSPPILHKIEQADSLAKGLTEISEEQRELLILRYCHDRSIKELAEIFSLSESATKMRIHRSLQELQEIMLNLES